MGTSKALHIEEAKRQMRSTSGCRFIYAKKDGSVREAFGTLNLLSAASISTAEALPGSSCFYDKDT